MRFPKTTVPMPSGHPVRYRSVAATYTWPHVYIQCASDRYGSQFVAQRLLKWRWDMTTAFSGVGCAESVPRFASEQFWKLLDVRVILAARQISFNSRLHALTCGSICLTWGKHFVAVSCSEVPGECWSETAQVLQCKIASSVRDRPEVPASSQRHIQCLQFSRYPEAWFEEEKLVHHAPDLLQTDRQPWPETQLALRRMTSLKQVLVKQATGCDEKSWV